MKAPHHCDMLRERAYDYRRGELSEIDRAIFEQELESCPSCALYVERLSQMLALAKDTPAAQWLEHDLDDAHTQAMFATILTSLGQPSERPELEPTYAEHDPADELIPLRDMARPITSMLRLAQTTSIAHEADGSLWLNAPIDDKRADALFDLISAKISDQREQDDDQDHTSLIPLRDQAQGSQALLRLAQTTSIAHEADASLWSDKPINAKRADALFDLISAQLDVPTDSPAPSPAQDNLIQLHFPQLDAHAGAINDDDEHTTQAPKRWKPALGILGLAAAAAALAIGAWWFQDHTQPTPATPSQLANAPELTPPQSPTAATNDAHGLDLGELKLAAEDDTAKEAIKVMASEGASWTITQAPKSKQYTLTLAQGTVLVEFVPRGGESLRVLAQGTEVQVVGTVFYVSTARKAAKASGARVGVLSGKVRVKREQHSPHPTDAVELTSGQELITEADTMTQIPQEQLTEGDKLIDLKAHEQKLALLASSQTALQAEPLPEPRRQAPVAPKAERADALKQKAQMAMRSRDYAHAATYYEQALRLSGQSEAATMQLELANLYVTHLNQPNRAVRHLKQFISQNPKDIATPTTRKQLCLLLKSRAQEEPLCSDTQDHQD